MNSIKQTKKSIYPVRVEGDPEKDGDVLWCTEMERYWELLYGGRGRGDEMHTIGGTGSVSGGKV